MIDLGTAAGDLIRLGLVDFVLVAGVVGQQGQRPEWRLVREPGRAEQSVSVHHNQPPLHTSTVYVLGAVYEPIRAPSIFFNTS